MRTNNNNTFSHIDPTTGLRTDLIWITGLRPEHFLLFTVHRVFSLSPSLFSLFLNVPDAVIFPVPPFSEPLCVPPCTASRDARDPSTELRPVGSGDPPHHGPVE